jgi:ParB family chromosome partitioning protein
MTSIKDRMMANTAKMPSLENIKPKADKEPKLRTAPGMMAALSNARAKIVELESNGARLDLPVKAISPNPYQPRRVFTEEALEELSQSIASIGLIQPILVRKDPANPEKYQVVVGERRLRAHERLGRENIPCLVVTLPDSQMALWALSENVARSNLTDYEISEGISSVMPTFPNNTKAAEALGLSRGQLLRLLSFSELPDFVREMLKVRPALLGANAADDLRKALKEMGEAALQHLPELLDRLSDGTLDQGNLVRALTAKLMAVPVPGERNVGVTKLYADGRLQGEVRRSPSAITIRLKTATLSPEREDLVRKLLVKLYGPKALS